MNKQKKNHWAWSDWRGTRAAEENGREAKERKEMEKDVS